MMSELETGNPAKIVPHDLVGTSVSVRIDLTAPGTGLKIGERYITGFCERFVQEDQDTQFAYYSAIIVPWFSFLEYPSNCRIFQSKSVTEIVEEVVGAYGYSKQLRLELSNTYEPRDYCVQYRETDRHFLSRLLENEGIFYYFEHKNGDHIMVLSDSPGMYKVLSTKSTFKYSPVTGLETTEDTIRSWRIEEEMHAGKWSHRDYHHEAPSNKYEVSVPSLDVAMEGTKFEVYDFPGDHSKKYNRLGTSGEVTGEGDRLARLRMEREETFHKLVSGWSACRDFVSGYKISVDGGFASGSYLLTELKHQINQIPAYRNIDNARQAYRNSFRAIPADTPYRHPAEHGRPAVNGLQTGFVIDESSSGNTEEIWPDKLGRILVRFQWDRQAKYAAWLRVVQPWAGRGWGHQWIPRVGDEVAVTFLEGDVDCPVVIGGVYNAANNPVFTLPANKTQSGILTRSTKNGGSSNYNLLRFEDKIGGEEIFVQAEKDWNSLIKNNETRTIKANRTSTIHVNESRTVETGDDSINVQKGKRTIAVEKNIETTSNTADILTNATQGNIASTAHISISKEAQTGDITAKACKNIVLEAGTQITLKCGGSTIVMTPEGIQLQAALIELN